MRHLVTGGAGFIGSHVVDHLLRIGHEVLVYDNLTTGHAEFLRSARQTSRFRFIEADVLDAGSLALAMDGIDTVFHLAANADVRFGTAHPDRDLQQNTIATFRVLEAMRVAGVSNIVFTSTGSVYGETSVIPTPEDAPFPRQTSLYSASKLAGEALISAYCEGFGMRGVVFRLVSNLGERYSHGHVFDFCRALRSDPTRLRVLGNGRQRKSYLYVTDCVEGMMTGWRAAPGGFSVFNLGMDASCVVTDSIGWICARLGVSPQLEFSGGERGWIGDNPLIELDCSRLRALGWKPTVSIPDSVVRTVDYLLANPWLLDPGLAAVGVPL